MRVPSDRIGVRVVFSLIVAWAVVGMLHAQAPLFTPVPAPGFHGNVPPVAAPTPPVSPTPAPSIVNSGRDPGPTGTPPAAMAKKGLGIVARADGVFARRLGAVNAKWFYSWGAGAPAGVPLGVEFIPMVWGWSDAPSQAGFMRGLGDAVRAHRFDTLLGFNEPDGKDQANLGVRRALEVWPQLMATGARLGSPAGIHPDGPWMREFMRTAAERKLRVDFITIHWYADPNPAGFLGYVDGIHKLYNRPVWITEFCPADWGAGDGKRPNRFNARQVQDFMRAVIPALKSRSYVERFAWFSPGAKDRTMGYSALFNDDGSLTDLGRIYANF